MTSAIGQKSNSPIIVTLRARVSECVSDVICRRVQHYVKFRILICPVPSNYIYRYIECLAIGILINNLFIRYFNLLHQLYIYIYIYTVCVY